MIAWILTELKSSRRLADQCGRKVDWIRLPWYRYDIHPFPATLKEDRSIIIGKTSLLHHVPGAWSTTVAHVTFPAQTFYFFGWSNIIAQLAWKTLGSSWQVCICWCWSHMCDEEVITYHEEALYLLLLYKMPQGLAKGVFLCFRVLTNHNAAHQDILGEIK